MLRFRIFIRGFQDAKFVKETKQHSRITGLVSGSTAPKLRFEDLGGVVLVVVVVVVVMGVMFYSPTRPTPDTF